MPLADYLAPLVGDKKRVAILDVASGPYPITGQLLDGVEVHVTHCDKQDFTDFWKEIGTEPLFPVEYQDMEKLTYLDDSFDIVHCVNALDHTKDIWSAVKEMLRVVKPGGWIYVDCALDQLTLQKKKHYWDAKEDGAFTSRLDLKELGFEIDRVERDQSHMIARKQC